MQDHHSVTTTPDARSHINAEKAPSLLVTLSPVLLLVVVLVVWGYAISAFGVAAFIYPLLGLVLAAFAFTLMLTRA